MENKGYDFIKGLYMNRIGFDKEVEISVDGMRGTVFLSEDCVSDGGTLPSPVRGLPVRNNKVYWFVYIRTQTSLKRINLIIFYYLLMMKDRRKYLNVSFPRFAVSSSKIPSMVATTFFSLAN